MRTERLTDIHDRLIIGGWLVALALAVAGAAIWRAIVMVAA